MGKISEIKIEHKSAEEFHPFENIALAFSGGGYRACAFSLGTLSYLQHLKINGNPVLENVKYISSASGGTITAAFYTLCNAQYKNDKEIKDFYGFYNKLKNTLKDDKLLENALKNLNNEDDFWTNNKTDKNKNIINAFANVYNSDLLFNEATIGNVLENHTSHLEQVCFNATDFYAGLHFRQQFLLQPLQTPSYNPYFGNKYARIEKQDILNKIKLADMLAASSCFPAGFEPIIFPDDYTHKELNKKDLQAAMLVEQQNASIESQINADKKTVALMDGGIADNQALHSMIRAHNERVEKNLIASPFDLMIVNDVSTYYTTPFQPEPEKTNPLLRVLTLKRLKIIAILLVAISIYLFTRHSSVALITATFLTTISLTFLGIYTYVSAKLFGWKSLFFQKKELQKDTGFSFRENFSPEVVELITKYFNSTRLSVFWALISNRFNSVIQLNTDIFMKTIRSLIYDDFFSLEENNKLCKANRIYDLSKSNKKQIDDKHKKYWAPYFKKTDPTLDTNRLLPTTKIMDIAEKATAMPTTLWFDKEETKKVQMLNDVIATGQFTTCYSLIRYIINLKESKAYDLLSPTEQQKVENTMKALLQDWEKFNHVNPYFLV
ncbi:MAG TPA: patatin-like phospholipase family protein [Chitinophagales bacterium]|nr:patatin-like phospholipase family protein [Chitinophagales bacterium]